MEWSTQYDQTNQPTWDDINDFINNNLWKELNLFLQDQFNVLPKLSYSKCSMQRGWNVKYQKSGKSLCTLYPLPGYFIALVAMGKKEIPEAEQILPILSNYTQNLYEKTPFSAGAKWLMIHVTNQNILRDVKELIKLRVSK